MKKIFFTLILFLIFFIPVSVMAFEVESREDIFITKEDVIEGNLYAFGTTVIINGNVKGDVISFAGKNLQINGTVEGDVIAGASVISINGEIQGSLRVVGEVVNINGDVMRGVQVLASIVNLGESSNVGKDILLGAEEANIDGNINGTIHGYISKAYFLGNVGGDIKLVLDERRSSSVDESLNHLTIQDDANINGNVYYVSGMEGFISDEAQIGGEVGYTNSRKYYGEKENPVFNLSNIIGLFSWMVIGLIIISLGKKHIKVLVKESAIPSWKKLGVGALVMFATPVVCVLVLFTIIGIPAALIVLVLWIIILYLAKILTAIIIGEKLINRFFPKKKNSLMWIMVCGILVVWLFCSIPIFGWLFCLLFTWYGVGSVWYYIRHEII